MTGFISFFIICYNIFNETAIFHHYCVQCFHIFGVILYAIGIVKLLLVLQFILNKAILKLKYHIIPTNYT